jgi:hypothetical protein
MNEDHDDVDVTYNVVIIDNKMKGKSNSRDVKRIELVFDEVVILFFSIRR